MQKKPKKKGNIRFDVKKYLAVLGISLSVVLCTFFVAMGFGFLGESDESGDVQIQEDSIVAVDKATGKVNVLLLGVDVGGLRTDAMMILSYDLDKDKVNILSIPRDTRMYIGSKYQKINAAHAITQSGKIKGPQGSIEAVTRLTGIPINFYVEFNVLAFRNTIDALGGVDFDVPRDMFYEDPVQDLYINLKKGYQHLDGDKSEQLVRFRRYPEGDIARVAMQQSFLKELFAQKLKPSIILKLPELFKQLNNDIKTNVNIVDITKYLPNIQDLKMENVKMYSLPGRYNDTDYGGSYWECDISNTKKLIEESFGYSASKATIHSADGTSKSKDVKRTVATPMPTKKPTIHESATPTTSPDVQKKTTTPTTSPDVPKKTTTPTTSSDILKSTTTPTASVTPKPTQTPKISDVPDKSPVPTKSTSPKKEETPNPTVDVAEKQ